MKLVVFSEAGFEYGYGHFYRMSGVCEKAKSLGENVEMHLMADEDAQKNLRRDYVFFTDWKDRTNFERVLDKESTLVVDSYHVDVKMLEQFQALARELIVIDDNIRLDYHDMKILNPNYFAVCLKYPKDKNNTLYVGGDCTLLRSEFEFSGNRDVKSIVANILISMGGTDPKGATAEIVRAVKEYSGDAVIHVVSTRAYHNLKEINDRLSENDKLHIDISASEMAGLMRKCDFAIVSAGQTSNEVIKMQCPSVLVVVADNQILNTRYLSEQGFVEAIYYHGELGDKDKETIRRMFNPDIRAALLSKEKEFVSDRSGKDLICDIAFGRN